MHPPPVRIRSKLLFYLLIQSILVCIVLVLAAMCGIRIQRHYALRALGAHLGYQAHDIEFEGLFGVAGWINASGELETGREGSWYAQIFGGPVFTDPVLIGLRAPDAEAFHMVRHVSTLQGFTCGGSSQSQILDFCDLPVHASSGTLRKLHLAMAGTALGKQSAQAISRCTSLEVLLMPRFDCDDDFVCSLGALNELRVIWLRGDSLSDHCFDCLERLPSLRLMILSSPKVSVSKERARSFAAKIGVTVWLRGESIKPDEK